MENTIIQLQEAIFHQGEDLERMSLELYTQQKELAELRAQIAKIYAKLKNMEEGDNIRRPDQETPPPHY